MSTILLPGDYTDSSNPAVKTGPGFYKTPLTDPVPVKAGLEVYKELQSGTFRFIDTNTKRYIPAVRDNVLGVVQSKHAEGFRVLLQEASAPIQLGQFAFANASKKNRVNLPAGAVVYGRIVAADPNIEPEMECVDSNTGQAGGYGELKGGNVFNVSLAYARYLLFAGGPVLEAIGETVAFEIAIGMNGKVWVNADDLKAVWKITRCIEEGQHWPADAVVDNVKKIFSS